MASYLDVRSMQMFLTEILHDENIAPIDIHRRLLNIYGDQTVNVSTVSGWVARFISSESDVKDKPRSGRPRTAVTPRNICSCSSLEKIHSQGNGNKLMRDKKLVDEDMNEDVKTVDSSCGQLSQTCQPESERKYDSSWYPTGLGNSSVRVFNGGQESSAVQRIQRNGSPCCEQSAMLMNFSYPKDNENNVLCGKRQLSVISQNKFEYQMDASQSSDDNIHKYNREQVKKDDHTDTTPLRVSPTVTNSDRYDRNDNAYYRAQQCAYNSLNFGLNNASYDYQEKALDLSGRNSSCDRERSGHDKTGQPTFANIGSPEAVSLFASNNAPVTATGDVPEASNSNQFPSLHSPTSDSSFFKPYSETSHAHNNPLPPLNTHLKLPKHLETITRNVPTIHRPIPTYPKPGYPFLSQNLNPLQLGAGRLQSTSIPFNYQVSNTYPSLFEQFHNSALPGSWTTKGTYTPRKTDYIQDTEQYLPCFSNDPNKSLASYLLPSVGHSNPPAETNSARISQLFPFHDAMLRYVANDERFLLSHMLWMNAIQNSQSENASRSEVNFQDGINISCCRPQLNNNNYGWKDLVEEFSPNLTHCYKRGNIPTPIRTQSWPESEAQVNGHAFLPVYNPKRKQHNVDITLRSSDGHTQSVEANCNKHLQSSSLSLGQDGDSLAPVDLSKTDSMMSFSMGNRILNDQLKNSSSECVYQRNNALHSNNTFCRENKVTRVKRLEDAYAHREMPQAQEVQKVFTQRSSNKLKRKLNSVGADNTSKLARNLNIATLVHTSQENNPLSITQTQPKNTFFCPMGKDMHPVGNDGATAPLDTHYLCVNGQPSCRNLLQCCSSQQKSTEKHLDYNNRSCSVSVHTLHCSRGTSPSSSEKYCDKCSADNPGDSAINSFACTETDVRNYSKRKDLANRRKCFKQAYEMIQNDNRTQQNSITHNYTSSNCSTDAVGFPTKANKKSPPGNTQRNKHAAVAEKSVIKLSDIQTYQACHTSSVKTRSPSILTKNRHPRHVSEHSRFVVNSNKEEQNGAMCEIYQTESVAAMITCAQTPANTDNFTPTTTKSGNVLSSYTIRGGKKKTSMEGIVAKKEAMFKCKDCNSSHLSFSALLQHQSRGCESTTLSSTPVHATDCVGSYMRYDTSWVGDKCQCTPCPVCKGIFGSKFRVYSHLQRGCYKDKVLRCTPDSISTCGFKSTFPEGRKTSGRCGLQCCLFRSEAEKIDERVKKDQIDSRDLQYLPSTDSNIQCLHRTTVETTSHNAFSGNGDIQKIPHLKTNCQIKPHVAKTIKSSVPMLNTRLNSNPLHCTSSINNYLVPQILDSEVTTHRENSPSCLLAVSVNKHLTRDATNCAPDPELKTLVITNDSDKINELPCVDQLQSSVDHPVSLPCNYDTLSRFTVTTAAMDNIVMSPVSDNTCDIKKTKMPAIINDTKSHISDKIVITKNTAEIKIDNGELDIKQEIDISADSSVMMDQPETSSRPTVNTRNLFREHALAMGNGDTKGNAPGGDKRIFPVTCNLGICGDLKRQGSTTECVTHKLYRSVLGQPVMSLRSSLLNDVINTTAVNHTNISTCPSVEAKVKSATGVYVCATAHTVGSSGFTAPVEQEYSASDDGNQLVADACTQPEYAVCKHTFKEETVTDNHIDCVNDDAPKGRRESVPMAERSVCYIPTTSAANSYVANSKNENLRNNKRSGNLDRPKIKDRQDGTVACHMFSETVKLAVEKSGPAVNPRMFTDCSSTFAKESTIRELASSPGEDIFKATIQN